MSGQGFCIDSSAVSRTLCHIPVEVKIFCATLVSKIPWKWLRKPLGVGFPHILLLIHGYLLVIKHMQLENHQMFWGESS